jgi:hypothetical protein
LLLLLWLLLFLDIDPLVIHPGSGTSSFMTFQEKTITIAEDFRHTKRLRFQLAEPLRTDASAWGKSLFRSFSGSLRILEPFIK